FTSILHTRQVRDTWVEEGFVNAEHARAESLQNPCPTARTGSEIETKLARLRPQAEQRKRLPQLEIGAAWCGTILDEPSLTVGKRTGARRRCEHHVRPNQGPGAEWRARSGRTEDEGLGRDFWKLVNNQRCTTMVGDGVESPIALYSAQLIGG